MTKGSRPCPACTANNNPAKVPVHPGCNCNVETVDINLGDDDGEGARHLAETAESDGGFTYSPLLQASPEKGYSVSPYPERSAVIENGEFRYSDLSVYVDKNSDLLARDNHYLGAWHEIAEEGKIDRIWLDVTVVLDDLDEAVALGRSANQIGIYDLAKGAVVETGGTGL